MTGELLQHGINGSSRAQIIPEEAWRYHLKIALVIPPVRDFYFTPQRASFLGPALLYDEIVREGFECEIFNGCSGKARRTQLPVELSYLAPYRGKEGFFKHYYRFGKLPAHLAGGILQWKPDIVFISSFAFCYALEAIEVANALRDAGYCGPIVFGGAGVSAHPAYYLQHTSATSAFVGEADTCLDAILRNPAGAPGMWYLEKENIISSASVAAKEFRPVILPMQRSSGVQYYSGMFTRGCPMKCGFCSSRLHMPGFRKASLSLIKELLEKTAWDKKSHLNIEDDAIVRDFDYLLEILYYYKKCAGGNATFSLENGIDYRALNKEKLKALAKQGLTKLNIALVSIDAAIAKRYGRTVSLDIFSEVVEAAHSHGIPTTAYLIAGLKGDTHEGVRRGLMFLSQLPVLIGISPFYPVPGIQDFEDRHFFDTISPRLCAGTSCYPWHDISTRELVELFCEARSINFSRREKNRYH